MLLAVFLRLILRRRSDLIVKPAWLRKKINLKDCASTKQMLSGLGLNTVCEQAICPNLSECFARSTATFLILGKNCTRFCSFCNIQKAKPLPLDLDEPYRVSCAVKRLGLKHVVITSVTRDDLADGGAGIFAATVKMIRQDLPQAGIELLIPDFGGSLAALETVGSCGAQIIGHNLETVPALYPAVRQGADYQRSLDVLGFLKQVAPRVKTKSGLMLGLGETEDEVLSVMRDLRRAECDFISIGQYLAPSHKHYPVKEYIALDKFDDYAKAAKALGFSHAQSAPYVRSSYRASEYLS
jgi:lipoyl synthase